MSGWEVVLLIAALAFAGLVKGVTGMGLPLFATPILAGVFGARPAVIIMSIPIFVTNLLLLYEGRRSLGATRDVWSVALPGIAGVILGLVLLVRLDQSLLSLLIAGIVIVFLMGGDRLLGTDPRALRMRLMGPVIGGFSGVLQGGTSIAAPLIGSYFYARRITAAEFVVSVALVFQVFVTVQVLGLWHLGLYDRTVLTMGLLGLIPTLLAFTVGVRLRARLNSATFRAVVTGFLVLSAVNLIVQGLRGLKVLP